MLARLRTVADEGTSAGRIERTRSTPRWPSHHPPFSAVQATWNILERSAQLSLQAAADHGWTVIVKEAMANGRLAPGETLNVDRLAIAAGTTSDALAIGAALAQDWAHIILSGAVTTAQLESNTRARPLNIGAAELYPLAIPSERYWAERAERK